MRTPAPGAELERDNHIYGGRLYLYGDPSPPKRKQIKGTMSPKRHHLENRVGSIDVLVIPLSSPEGG